MEGGGGGGEPQKAQKTQKGGGRWEEGGAFDAALRALLRAREDGEYIGRKISLSNGMEVERMGKDDGFPRFGNLRRVVFQGLETGA